MTQAVPPEPVWPFVGVLAANGAALDCARKAVSLAMGSIGLEAGPFSFHHTEYYARETGPSILRLFFGFTSPVSPDWLAGAKTRTNELEAEAARVMASAVSGGWPRPVNLDPGYVTPAKVVLASAKDFNHRVYLRDGIYAEVTLRYRRGSGGTGRYEAFPWTFPDFAEDRYHPFLLRLRGFLMRQRAAKTTARQGAG